MISTTRSCFRCGADIYWNTERKSKSGKLIPLDVDTNQPHDCPEYHKSVGQEVMDLESKERQQFG